MDWPYDLTAEEQGLGPLGILKRYLFATLPAEISDPEAWNRPPLARLDDMTLAEYMRSQGASQGGVELIRDTQWFGVFVDTGSALSSALSDFGLFMGGVPFVLAGGNDRLPRGMADRLARRILYGTEVVAISDTGAGVEVSACRGDRVETLQGDRAICTLPATIVRSVRIEPELPAEQRIAAARRPTCRSERPHGRIHFAGEHTSVLRSSMEGALRSGIRAVIEVTENGLNVELHQPALAGRQA